VAHRDQNELPLDYAKKKYLKQHESGWLKVTDFLLRQAPDVFESTLGHIKKHTMYEHAMMPEEHKNLLDQQSSTKDSPIKDRIRPTYTK
jgi:hypothetical protein